MQQPNASIRIGCSGDGEGKYSGRYSDEALLSWTEWMVEQAQAGRPVLAYFNNDIVAHAIHDALTLRAMVRHTMQ